MGDRRDTQVVGGHIHRTPVSAECPLVVVVVDDLRVVVVDDLHRLACVVYLLVVVVEILRGVVDDLQILAAWGYLLEAGVGGNHSVAVVVVVGGSRSYQVVVDGCRNSVVAGDRLVVLPHQVESVYHRSDLYSRSHLWYQSWAPLLRGWAGHKASCSEMSTNQTGGL